MYIRSNKQNMNIVRYDTINLQSSKFETGTQNAKIKLLQILSSSKNDKIKEKIETIFSNGTSVKKKKFDGTCIII